MVLGDGDFSHHISATHFHNERRHELNADVGEELRRNTSICDSVFKPDKRYFGGASFYRKYRLT